ncbi:RNA polymerase sigma factor [Hymenobacter actinosclerus]|uniref:RNA polymerase sigma-70 factor, ECF subfamily n=1 Tax=Hymenobacter actinosclerus TaxID=82805 RepID=A0A1I0AE35_9BACT|nr:sigma-70 family RNA polymerase sigma factor [Hymenobacter actinosclerus]SES92470.1 RNA polymerase sigma-70 factor, ECF subfamily [Hymenobacter actinosclerus]
MDTLALSALAPPLPAAHVGSAAAVAGAEAELVVQLQGGSEAAFRTLVTRYQNRVYRTVLALLRSPEEAEDVAQEVFVEVYQTIGRFRGEATLATWLYRLATSRALKHQRQARARKRFAYFTSLLGLDNRVLHEPPDHETPQTQLEGAQQVELLRARLARLPDQQQVAFTLRHEQELSYEEIAAVLQTTVPAVESLLFRARQTLCAHLQPNPRHV